MEDCKALVWTPTRFGIGMVISGAIAFALGRQQSNMADTSNAEA